MVNSHELLNAVKNIKIHKDDECAQEIKKNIKEVIKILSEKLYKHQEGTELLPYRVDKIVDVKTTPGGWEVIQENGCCLYIKEKWLVEPHIGDDIAVYGFPGMLINGICLKHREQYRTLFFHCNIEKVVDYDKGDVVKSTSLLNYIKQIKWLHLIIRFIYNLYKKIVQKMKQIWT